MTTSRPSVDVNLFVYNGARTIGAAIESVLAQTWSKTNLLVVDNASTDDTLDIVGEYMKQFPGIRLYRARANGGAVVNCQRAFTLGDADYILPKTADDVLAPEFIERAMDVLLAHPDCAMCHAGGLVFSGAGVMRGLYPDIHRLHAVGEDPRARARHVMARYTSAPSFWGVYRREAVQSLSAFRYRAGWDHVVLAELALYGEIRHVPEPLYWRRDGGKPIGVIARACTEEVQRGLDLDDELADLRWLTPLITTAYAHIEMFAVGRCDFARRAALMDDAVQVFRNRWLPAMRREASAMEAFLARPTGAAASATAAAWRRHQVALVLDGVRTLLPDHPIATDVFEAAGRGGKPAPMYRAAPACSPAEHAGQEPGQSPAGTPQVAAG